ncbi:1117_t:CDS:2 [Entrophospora sp. SA101]|nr:1117_t:CDS:2 [Entrophospora sp. SA101]
MISNTNNNSGQSETLAQVSLSKESDFTKYIDFQLISVTISEIQSYEIGTNVSQNNSRSGDTIVSKEKSNFIISRSEDVLASKLDDTGETKQVNTFVPKEQSSANISDTVNASCRSNSDNTPKQIISQNENTPKFELLFTV